MRFGIIDLGTNTIRLSVFECEDRSYMEIYDQAVYSQIVDNTVDGVLSQEGTERIIEGIEELFLAARHFRCDKVECFATASLRGLSNADDIVEQIAFRTGVNVRRISGDEEAHYDYVAISREVKNIEGVACDLGGGSFQLLQFDKKGIKLSHSFLLGSGRIAKKFVMGSIPTKDEQENIGEEIKSAISKEGFTKEGKTLYMMGGTAKTMVSLCKRTILKNGFGNELPYIKIGDLETIIKVLVENPLESQELLEDIAPKRIKTLVPGMIIIYTIAKTLGCKGVTVSSVGVRDGFISEMLNQ